MNVFINEFHYDNVGTDAGEFIEIAGPAGTDLTGWSIVRYNGNTPGAGVVYVSPGSTLLSGVIGNLGNGFGVVSISLPVDGLQNGGNDGFALVDNLGNVIQFLSYEGAVTAANGPAAGMTSTNISVAETSSTPLGASLSLTGTGSQASDFTWTIDLNDTPGAINNGQTFIGVGGDTQVSIGDVTITEGNAGTVQAVFTVTRSDTNGEFSVDFATLNDGTATAGSDFVSTSGTLFFTVGGAASQTISVTINGDTTSEPNESFTVFLSNIVNTVGTAVRDDDSGVGTILNDDISVTRIHDIQGAAHISPLLGQVVSTTGIVTAVDSNGFYLQDKDANADSDIATSEAIFVFTSSAPSAAIVVGNEINITGTVSEFTPGGASTGNLSTTQLSSPTGITVLSTGNALPSAIVLGAGGRMAPTEVIEDDNFASFDPVTDGMDYFESMEGMRVTVPTPRAVSNTNSFGEIYTVADNGANATNLSARGTIVTQGSVGDGLLVTNTGPGSDYNPERIQIDADSTITPGGTPLVDVGAVLNDITGVLSYNFGNFEVVPTSAITVATASTLTKETTALVGTADTLTIASYNVLNLDPNDSDGDTDVADGRFTNIANQIVNNLQAPDIIALQEVQDNSGSANNGVVSANVTLQTLVDAIVAAGGPTYSFIDNTFITDNTNGGEPGGNIRNAFLYDASRVSLDFGSVGTTTGAATAFAGSRPPLVATFEFNDQAITLINNHFSSKGGSTPLYGTSQPSLNGSAQQRLDQAQNVADYIADLAPGTKTVVLGDLNEFTNEESLAPLTGVGLSAMSLTLTAQERYSYIFDGNAQELDQIYVSSSVASIAQFDIVHANSEFAFTNNTASDHDPSVLALNLAAPNFTVIGGIKVYEEAASLQGSVSTPVASNDVVLVRLGSIAAAVSPGAESIAFKNGKAYSSNTNADTIEVTRVTAEGVLVAEAPIALSGLIEYGDVNSVAVNAGVIAVAYQNVNADQSGYVALFNSADNSLIKTIQVGILPDHLTFSPDGSKLLVANEGEAISSSNNPVGSVSIIDMSGGAAAATVVNTISFDSLNGSEALLKAQGLALLAGQTASGDIEPEYISISPDGTRAYVTLQEVNAVAVIDLTNPAAVAPLSIQPLGAIDRSLPGNAFDGSDQDGAGTAGLIDIQNYDVLGLPQPDAIASYTVGGVTYFITANEGDSRVGTGITDSVRLNSATYVLDPTAYPNAAALKDNDAIGRLNVLTNIGDTDGDGDFDQIYTLGGRSISIFRQEADGSITKVRETGGEFEAITASLFPASFNSNQSTTGFDSRSDDKGPEPEGVSIGEVNGRVYAFVGLERVGGYMVYDVTDPANASFVSYKPQTGADLGPETSAFVSAADSPTGQALLLSAQEISNTVTLYSIQTQSEGDDTIIGGVDTESWNGRGGNDSIRGNGGNDTIDGGTGTDTSVYGGDWVGYSVTGGGSSVIDLDILNGDDGTDILQQVEILRFNGVNVAAADAVNDAPIGGNDNNSGDALAEDGDSTAAGNALANDNDADLALGLGESLIVNGLRAGNEAAGGAVTGFAGSTTVNGTYGQLTMNASGTYSYTLDNTRAATQALNNGQTVVESFTYEVTDAHGLTDTTEINLSISGAAEGYRLQLLHLSDGEAGTLAPTTAPYLAALVDKFEDEFANSITLAGGDTFLPGPFLAAGTDPSIVSILNALTGSTIAASGAAPGVVDTAIHNLIGVQATGIGNHEWDLGSNVYLSSLTGGGFSGAQYASISANLVLAPAGFPADPLNARFTQTVGTGILDNEEAQDLKARIAPSAVINEGGERIGLVGVTTQILESISSPTGAEILGFPFGTGANGETNDMALLAAQLQPVINDLIAQGVNKIVLLSHLQQITFEKQLAPLLTGVDIILAAGSNTRLGDADDVAVAFPGHAADFADTYPIVTAGADGKTTVIVNTDNEYTYLGRLVVDFDDNGEIILASLTENVSINGAYASTAGNVAEAWGDLDGDLSDTAFAAGTRGGNVALLTDAVNDVIIAKDGNIFGYSNVYLEGERIQVRNQETNLGNVSADANADAARDALGFASDIPIVSIKNGGGIRAQIGTIINNPDGTVTKVAPDVGGEVSQLDIENALRFDNKLMVFDTTPQGLLNILNSPNALAPNNGGFIQIGGVQFSYDATRPAGQRVRDVALVDENGNKIAAIANDGVVLAGAPAIITAVALNFTANGGDGYLVKANADNFRYILNDGTLSAPVSEALDFTAPANVPLNAIGEQQAFAEYFQERYATPETAFDLADTGQSGDLRIQNQAARVDTVLVGETLNGDQFINALTGGAFNDSIFGFANRDTLVGNGGDDVLDGGTNRDVMIGGTGNDFYYVDNAFDVVTENAGEGTDSVISSIQLTLAANVENGTIIGAANFRLSGNTLDNRLTGNSGNNRLEGFAGNDVISGGNGIDTILGGLGLDIMTGGANGDRFQFSALAETGVGATRDVITDFEQGIDRIALNLIDANTTKGNNQAFSFIGDAGFGNVAGQLRTYNDGTNTIVAGDVDGDGIADFEIALTGTHTLISADFIL